MSYRLHIDIPVGHNQDDAILAAKAILFVIESNMPHLRSDYVTEWNYRLGNDEDRSKKNYLRINENGHAANGKVNISLKNKSSE